MVEFIWKERIAKKRKMELEKRGVRVAKSEKENKEFLKAVEERGGIVNPVKEGDIGIEVLGPTEAQKDSIDTD